MSDEPQAPDEGTPDPVGTAPEAPDTAQQESPSDYQKRYDDMRPEFDRRGSRLTELEQREQWFELLATTDDPDTRRQAAQALGYEVADDEPEYADPSEALAAEVAAIKEQLANQSQEAQQAAQLAQIETHVEQQLTALDGLDQEDKAWVVDRAVRMPPKQTPQGLMVPDIEGAHQAFVAWEQGRQKRRVPPKQAHHFSPVGEAGTQQPDRSTREGRDALVLGLLAQEED